VFLLLFTYWPLVVSVVGSFQRFGRGGTAPRWVGWQNYWDLWNDALFHQVLVNTGIYALIAGPVAVARCWTHAQLGRPFARSGA